MKAAIALLIIASCLLALLAFVWHWVKQEIKKASEEDAFYDEIFKDIDERYY